MSAPLSPDDATLAVAAASGDRGALGEIYRRHAPALWRLCQSMLRNRSDAEDCLQDVFVIAATRLGGLREPAMLRSWLFAVARHECLARIDRRGRDVPVDTIPDGPDGEGDAPMGALLDSERAALVRDSVAGLTERDQLVLELADGQGLSGAEFAAALGVPRATAYTLLARARATARDAVGALLVARTGRSECDELDALLRRWDGRLTTLDRKRITRHLKRCPICGERLHRVTAPAALLGGGVALAAALEARVLAAASRVQPVGYVIPDGGLAAATPPSPHAENWEDGWPPADRQLLSGPPPLPRSWIRAAGAGVALLAVALLLLGVGGAGGYLIWHQPVPVTAAADVITPPRTILRTVPPTASVPAAPPVIETVTRVTTVAHSGASSGAAAATTQIETATRKATTTATETRTRVSTRTATVTAGATVTAAPPPAPAVTRTVDHTQTATTTATSTQTATVTVSAPTPPTRLLTIVSSYPTTVYAGRSLVNCYSGNTCALAVPDGTPVAIKNDGGAITGPDCAIASGGNGLCTFTIHRDETITSSR